MLRSDVFLGNSTTSRGSGYVRFSYALFHRKTILRPAIMALVSMLIIAMTCQLALAQTRQILAPIAIAADIQFNRMQPTVPQSFMGFSIEWGLIDHLTTTRYGRLKTMIRLINQLEQYNGPMVLRIGGNSEDESAYDLPQDKALPKFVHINISNHTLAHLAALAHGTDCKFIIGLNLAADRPDLAVKLVKAAQRIIGNTHILAFEIGNEIDFLHRFGGIWKHETFQTCMRRWNRNYNAIKPYLKRHNQIAGPAFGGHWNRFIPQFLEMEHQHLCLVSVHRYPLGAPIKNPHSPAFASIAHLLSNRAALTFGPGLMKKTVAEAKAYNLPVRWAEMNSAYGGGKKSISSSFASALWCTDALFEAAEVGASGVNLHMSERFDQFPGAYDPIYFLPHQPLQVRPEFYGMLVFARAIQGHARLVPVVYHTKYNVKIWAAIAADHTLRVIVINKDSKHNAFVHLNIYNAKTFLAKSIHGYQLTAPSITATYGLKLNGMTYDGGKNGRMTGTPEFRRKIAWVANAGLVAKPDSIVVGVFNESQP